MAEAAARAEAAAQQVEVEAETRAEAAARAKEREASLEEAIARASAEADEAAATLAVMGGVLESTKEQTTSTLQAAWEEARQLSSVRAAAEEEEAGRAWFEANVSLEAQAEAEAVRAASQRELERTRRASTSALYAAAVEKKARQTAEAIANAALCRSILTESRTAAATSPVRKRDRAASMLSRARALGRGGPGGDGGTGSTVYVALSDGRLVSLSCDLGAMASARDGVSLHHLFGELRSAIGSSLQRHRYYALAKQLPMLRLQAEAVVSPVGAPLLLLEPEGGVPSRCPTGTLNALCAAEAVRVTLVEMNAP